MNSPKPQRISRTIVVSEPSALPLIDLVPEVTPKRAKSAKGNVQGSKKKRKKKPGKGTPKKQSSAAGWLDRLKAFWNKTSAVVKGFSAIVVAIAAIGKSAPTIVEYAKAAHKFLSGFFL